MNRREPRTSASTSLILKKRHIASGSSSAQEMEAMLLLQLPILTSCLAITWLKSIRRMLSSVARSASSRSVTTKTLFCSTSAPQPAGLARSRSPSRQSTILNKLHFVTHEPSSKFPRQGWQNGGHRAGRSQEGARMPPGTKR